MSDEFEKTLELNENEQFVKDAKEYRGWDLPSESYKIGDESWKIQKDCKIPAKEEKIRALSDKIEEIRTKLEAKDIIGKEAHKTVIAINKEILEMCLIGFKYDISVEKYGHKALGQVSKVMQGIFLMFGGWEEMIYMIKQGMEESMLLSKLAKGGLDGESGSMG